ncbi:MAG: diguanylate cyclase domain-containing protein [Methyloceanibacter sp.]
MSSRAGRHASRRNVREADVVGRLGGDEFAVVAEELDSPEAAMRLARRL